jgi:hypothetical protein
VCNAKNCKNKSTKKVRLSGRLYLDRRIDISEDIELCDEHWEDLNSGMKSRSFLSHILPISEVSNFNYTEIITGQ